MQSFAIQDDTRVEVRGLDGEILFEELSLMVHVGDRGPPYVTAIIARSQLRPRRAASVAT
jgi:hypothetical protein